jgi:hypothetical protein
MQETLVDLTTQVAGVAKTVDEIAAVSPATAAQIWSLADEARRRRGPG